MILIKKFIGSEIQISEPFKATIKVVDENIDFLLKLKMNHLFENDNDTDKPTIKPRSVNTTGKK